MWPTFQQCLYINFFIRRQQTFFTTVIYAKESSSELSEPIPKVCVWRVDVAHWNNYRLIISSRHTWNSFIWKHVCSNKHQSCNKINKLHPPFLLQHQCSFACALNNKTTSYKSCSSCSEEKSPLVTVSLTPNNTLNTKTIGGMTCLCFLGQIKRDLTSCSYTTQL